MRHTQENWIRVNLELFKQRPGLQKDKKGFSNSLIKWYHSTQATVQVNDFPRLKRIAAAFFPTLVGKRMAPLTISFYAEAPGMVRDASTPQCKTLNRNGSKNVSGLNV